MPQSVNAAVSPELKERVRNGSLFTWNCPHCGTSNLLKLPFLYHDPTEKLMLVLTDAPVNADALPDGYTGRFVRSVGDLIEKLKIFDCGLDDLVIEMCKFVTAQELGKDVSLKFLKSDGADGEMTFTYPEKGQMELLAVGFNVYEDCAGILARNPQVRDAAKGLAEIDQAWLSRFFR
ncbi:MAG: hypothetical protein GXY24_00065 [Bacteroidales bacterium]|nr:hypothetical protein [Bacteroidales bacterium]